MQQPEQDNDGTDDLPSYEHLAAQKGPNSRFGRWKGWVEKRAAERYANISPEERVRRRERGWGEGLDEDADADGGASAHLQVHTDSEADSSAPPSYTLPSPEPTSVISHGDSLPPSHLKLHNFGSRSDDGLSVLDMFPSGDPETSSPADAVVRTIWEGEGVYQLEVLEFEESGGSTPQGVVLALVGSDIDTPGGKDQDNMRTIRMYNLASLTSLARWAVTQKGVRPLDLRRPANWTPQHLSPKKHRHQSSISKGFKSLIIDSPSGQSPEPRSSYQNMMPPAVPHKDATFQRTNSVASTDSTWDMVDDFPLRWATDYVPLAAAGSRLRNSSVLFFELKRDEYRTYGGNTHLAVATKSSILLYETPKGERAFCYVKEFYTPLAPRSVTFVRQRVPDNLVARSVSHTPLLSTRHQDVDARRQSMHLSNGVTRDRRPIPVSSPAFDHTHQMNMFVIFEKKAGLIRLADSAVGEVELFDDYATSYSPSGTLPRLSRTSLDNFSFVKEAKVPWLPPVQGEFPVLSSTRPSQSVYFVTRGTQTHILPDPLPVPISSCPPLHVLTWLSQPLHVCQRVCSPPDSMPFLQVIGLGEFGVEVQELPLTFMSKGKGKARSEEPIRSQADVGGDAGFLLHGGTWHKPKGQLSPTESVMSFHGSNGTSKGQTVDGRTAEQGIYAWCRKGMQDWRVFWLGGMDNSCGDTMDCSL